MKAEPPSNRGVISGKTVRRSDQPVLVDCGQSAAEAAAQPITVAPVIDGEDIVGFEVRCSCGASVIVECIYEEKP